jgi:hypothetical protein
MTNNLAYFSTATITTKKLLIQRTPGIFGITLFFVVTYDGTKSESVWSRKCLYYCQKLP